jgi:hypothetical protein
MSFVAKRQCFLAAQAENQSKTYESIPVFLKVESQDTKRMTYKYYFKAGIPKGWCAFRYNSDGTMLKLSFPEDKVPYLGIWVNQGDFHNYENIALEMCTGSLDRPDVAKLHSMNSVLKAKDEYSWFLNFQIDSI